MFQDLTRADEEHIVGLVKSLYSVHSELCVAHVSFEEQRLAANHAIHEEVILHEVQHFIRHVQRGGDPLGTGRVGDALQENGKRCFRNTAQYLNHCFLSGVWLITPKSM